MRICQRNSVGIGLLNQTWRKICLEIVGILNVCIKHQRPVLIIVCLVDPDVKLLEVPQTQFVELAVVKISTALGIPGGFDGRLADIPGCVWRTSDKPPFESEIPVFLE